jgi:hypothetical protein
VEQQVAALPHRRAASSELAATGRFLAVVSIQCGACSEAGGVAAARGSTPPRSAAGGFCPCSLEEWPPAQQLVKASRHQSGSTAALQPAAALRARRGAGSVAALFVQRACGGPPFSVPARCRVAKPSHTMQSGGLILISRRTARRRRQGCRGVSCAPVLLQSRRRRRCGFGPCQGSRRSDGSTATYRQQHSITGSHSWA